MIDDPRRIIKRTRSNSSATEGDRERRPRPKGVACERSEWGSGPGRKGCVYTGNIYINSPFFIVPHDRIIIFCQYIFCVLTSYFHTLPCNKPIQRQNALSPADGRPRSLATRAADDAERGRLQQEPRRILGRLQDNPSQTTTTRGTPSAPPPQRRTPRCVSETSPNAGPPQPLRAANQPE